MGRIPDEDVQRVRDATDVVALIGETVEMKRKGRLFWGRCPFHSEKTPSFKVDPGTQLWHCFGCGAGGDAFGFIMQAENLDFPDAVRCLAERSNVEIREEGGAATGERGRLTAACEAAADYYHRVLTTSRADAAEAARIYLSSRGFGTTIAGEWTLGYAPGSGALVTHLKGQGFTEDELVRAGLASRPERGQGIRDRFFERVMFPIRDVRGKTVGFGGRVLGSGEPKYLNSSETPLFHKSSNMYGIERAKGAIVAAGHAIVVEGYTDVIALHEAGVKNAVATLGTALTDEHVRLLSRFAKRVVYLFDGDEAGVRAALRAADLVDWEAASEVGEHGVEYAVALVPGGSDPADHVKEHGAEGISEVVAGAVPLLRFVLDRRFAEHDLGTPEGRTSALASAAGVLAALGRESMLAQDYMNQVADRLLVDYPTVAVAVSRAKPTIGRAAERPPAAAPRGEPAGEAGAAPSGPAEGDARVSGPQEAVEREIARMVIAVPELRKEARELLYDELIVSRRYAALLEAVADAGMSVGSDLFATVTRTDPDAGAMLSALAVGGEIDPEHGRFVFRESTRRLKEYALERQIVAKKAAMKALDPQTERAEHDRLFREVAGLLREREALRSEERHDMEA